MKKYRFLITLSLAVVLAALCFFALPAEANATATEYTEGDYTYTVSNNEATLVYYSGPSGQLTVPATLGGYPVTAIGPGAYRDKDGVYSIVLPESVKSIGADAFMGSYDLSYNTYDNGYYLGTENNPYHALVGTKTTTITSCKVHKDTKVITDLVFYNCQKLTSITVDADNTNFSSDTRGVLFNNDKTTLIQVPRGITGSYKMPDGITTIGAYALAGSSLNTTTISNSVRDIGDYAFSESKLIGITIPDNVMSVGYGAFYNCDLLGSAVIGRGVTTISKSLFNKCGSMRSVAFRGAVTVIGDNAFCNTALSSVTIPATVKTIGANAFSYTGLTSVTIPEGVTTIGDLAFFYTNIASVSVPDSVTTFGNSVFTNGKTQSLEYNVYDNAKYLGNEKNPYVVLIGAVSSDIIECKIHDDTKIIGYNAFSACGNLKSVTGGKNVITINESAFYTCYYLSSVSVGGNVTTIGRNAFNHTHPAIHYGGTYQQWTQIEIAEGNDYLKDQVNLVLYCKIPEEGASGTCGENLTWTLDAAGNMILSGTGKMNDYTKLPNGMCTVPWQRYISGIKSVKIEQGITKIGKSAFENCTGLETLTIANSVAEIGSSAFRNCDSLTLVTIPEGVTLIDYWAFNSCDSLTAIQVHENNKQFSSDETGVLFDKEKNVLKQAPGKIEGTYAIPANVWLIEQGAFENCVGLTEISIPDTVTTIADYAFSACDILTDVYYGDTAAFWNKIAISNQSNDPLLNATIHYSEHTHRYTQFVSDNNATCTADGTETAVCKKCQEKNTRPEVGSKLGHHFAKYKSDNNATYDADGTKTAKCDRCDETHTVIDPGSKKIRTGWHQIGGKWYYFNANGYMVTNQWRKDSNGWCWLTAFGEMATNQWVKDSKGWCYVGANGYCWTNRWAQDSIGWIWLDSEGSMTKDKWIQDGGKWYYLDSNGYMVTSQWRKDSNGWIWLDSQGSMTKSQWIKDGNNWYYLNASGYMVTGTVKIGNTTYTFASNGVWIP